jgi:hypothetical protein
MDWGSRGSDHKRGRNWNRAIRCATLTSGMRRFPILNLGQAKPSCPAVRTPEGLNCQQTPEGGILCSDESYYPVGCPAPAVTLTGVAAYVMEAGQVKLVAPPPANLGQETGTQFPWLLVAIPVVGVVISVLW